MSDSAYDISQVINAVYESRPSGSIISAGSVDTSSTILLGYNPKRSLIILQNTAGVLYVKLGVGAGTGLGNYSFTMEAGQVLSLDQYGNMLSAVRATGTGTVIVTEVS